MSVFDEIKAKVDIVDLVSETVALTKAGRSYKANCPFHSERTPSFTVSPDRGTWHCFGACSTGGDIFAFVQKRDDVELPEALRTLAERAGVALERRSPERAERNERLLAANEAAAAFYENRLRGSDDASDARAYLERRGLDDATIRDFRLGYAPGDWDALRSHLERRGFGVRELIDAGLVVESDRGGYDRFRGRLLFPIADERGRVLGFGGRTLTDDDGPKYLNTPQTAIFDKGAVVYGIDRAREAIRKSEAAVVVEGYMDVIAAHQHGYTNVVASMGTALTERQVSLLKRFSRNLTLALDADAAGSEATLRGVRVAVDAAERDVVPVVDWRGLVRHQEALAADIRIVALPPGKDPDETIRERPEAWPELLATARPVLDHLLAVARDRYDLSQPRERSKALQALLPPLADVADPVVRAHYLQRVANVVRVDEATLQAALRRGGRRPSRTEEEPPTPSPGTRSHSRGGREAFLLALLIRHPSLRERGLAIDPDTFREGEHRALFERWRRDPEPPADDDSLHDSYRRFEATELPPYDMASALAALESALRLIERDRLREAKRIVSSALIEGVEGIDQSSVIEAALAALAADGDTAALAPEVALALRDTEAGIRLHRGDPALATGARPANQDTTQRS